MNYIEIEEIGNLGNLSLNELNELTILQNNINHIKYYLHKDQIYKLSTKFLLLINSLYTQNQIYLDKISFDSTKYTYNGEFEPFTKNQINLLLNIKNKIDESNKIFNSLKSIDNKMWNVNIIYKAFEYCLEGYQDILRLVK